mmetsp:Transcript_18826/g.52325  ORF Transcript_18826/g.52325 Transcript_18826/m.52325 type:complete len:320 (-) Transcript_18826:250-1209(-)
MKLSIATLVGFAGCCLSDAFVAPRSAAFKVASASQLHATPTAAIAAFDQSQAASVDAIAAAIPDLAPKVDSSWTPASGVTIAGCPTALDARDAPGPANIAWLSSLSVQSQLSSLTIYNGPLTDVPHLFSKCAIVNDGASIEFVLDFRPRAYGNYEMRDAAGNYPGPDELGRKAFEYSGARRDFDTKFGTEQVITFLSSTVAALEGAVPTQDSPTEEDALIRGPLYTSLTMPLTDNNVATLVAARQQAASIWLGWANDNGAHDHRPGAPINSQYVYDTKYRQNSYGSLLSYYSNKFGPDGAKLAAADSGPLDEGYVGGGS